MTSLRLDADTGDLDLSSGTVRLVDGADEIAQKIRIRLRFFLGEWFLDTRLGVPWFQKVLGKKRKKAIVDVYIKRVVLTTPGVQSIDSFSMTFDGVTRKLSVSFTCVTTAGEVLTFDDLFLIEG